MKSQGLEQGGFAELASAQESEKRLSFQISAAPSDHARRRAPPTNWLEWPP
jgi:hypothetical protein